MLILSNLSLEDAASGWPEDFFSDCVADYPRNFKEVNSPTTRGTAQFGATKFSVGVTVRKMTNNVASGFAFKIVNPKDATADDVNTCVKTLQAVAKSSGLRQVKSLNSLKLNTFCFALLGSSSNIEGHIIYIVER